jgi:hypothetical protein
MKNFLLLLCLSLAVLPAYPQDDVEVVVVTGKRPGPPLWKVTNGENTLWILPLVLVVPKNMEWDDARVAALIAQAQEVISTPNVSYGVSKGVLLNPVNAFRAMRMWKHIQKNPDDATLVEVLPATVYARYSALKLAYFPRDRDIDQLRPSVASQVMFTHVMDAEELITPAGIVQRVQKHIRNNKDIVVTETRLEHTLQGKFSELRTRAESLMNGLDPEQEAACFDLRLGVLEHQVDDIKAVANAWANGSSTGFADFLDEGNIDNPCASLMLKSSEGELLGQLELESRQLWLDAAQKALEKNRTTFAMLPLAQIMGDASFVDELGARGFAVREPQ